MTNAGNPFKRLVLGGSQNTAAVLQARAEHAKVMFLLKYLNVPTKKRTEFSRVVARDYDGYYTLALFNAMFPSFPVLLGYTSLPKLKVPLHQAAEAFHPVWFKTFMKLPFMKEYETAFDLAAAAASNKPVGLIFPRRGFQQGLIVHNGNFYTYVGDQCSCHVYKTSKVILIVQPLQSFLTVVSKEINWVPSVEEPITDFKSI